MRGHRLRLRRPACSIFEDEAVAELLTTGKLSELAVLTLYLMCVINPLPALVFYELLTALMLYLT